MPEIAGDELAGFTVNPDRHAARDSILKIAALEHAAATTY